MVFDVGSSQASRTRAPSMRPTRFLALVIVIGLPLVASACAEGVARLPDCIDCRPVEMSIDQPLEVELGSDRAVTNDPDAFTWVLADTGAMTLVSEERGTRPEDEDEFIGGYSRFVIYTFEATEAATTQLRFEFVPVDDPNLQPTNVLDITVIITD